MALLPLASAALREKLSPRASGLGFDQGFQILSNLVNQQPTRALIEIPDPGPGERPRASARRVRIAEQHQDLCRGMPGQFNVTRMPDQALQGTVLGPRGDGETASARVVLSRAADQLVSVQAEPDELRVTQVAHAGCGRKFEMCQQLSAEVTLINDAAAAVVYSWKTVSNNAATGVAATYMLGTRWSVPTSSKGENLASPKPGLCSS